MKILIINGPNLNLLGKREPETYGSWTMESLLSELREQFSETEILYFQSNHEGEIIDRLHAMAESDIDGLVINSGAYTHYSYAIRDALRIIQVPKVEVHISHVYKREAFRHISVTAPVCDGLITGFGKHSYIMAVYSLLNGSMEN